MKSLNHQHLYYFWQTTREGGMLAASRTLGISQPTISVQVGELERFFGKPLFERHGKSLELTDFGRLVANYAEEIFSTSQELVEVALGRQGELPARVRAGVVDVIPKGVAFSLLHPIVKKLACENCMVSVSEGSLEALISDLISRHVDIVISDAPLPPESRARVFTRRLASLDVNVVANADTAARLRRNFPKSLNGAPFLLPRRDTMLRRELDLWFHEAGVHPRIVGEFDDTALMKEFARAGVGAMPVAGVPAKESLLAVVGSLAGLQQNFFLLFPERRNVDAVVRLFGKGER
jgi:LysR family transcriptional activator of nhaA